MHELYNASCLPPHSSTSSPTHYLVESGRKSEQNKPIESQNRRKARKKRKKNEYRRSRREGERERKNVARWSESFW
jgi:hypothetical protein